MKQLAIALVLLAGLATTPGHAEETVTPSASPILIYDAERLATEPKVLQSLFSQIDALKLQQVVAHNQVLDVLEAEFAPIRDAESPMPPEEYKKALDEFNKAAAELDAALAEAEQGINAAADEALAKFIVARQSAEAELLEQFGARQFVDMSAVLYLRPGTAYDKTDALIAAIDTKLSDLEIRRPDTDTPSN